MLDKETLEKIAEEFEKFKFSVSSLKPDDVSAKISDLKVHYVGKNGIFKSMLRELKDIEHSARLELSQQVNALKDRISTELENLLKIAEDRLREEKLQNDTLDLTVCSRGYKVGSLHPIRRVEKEIIDILKRVGFSVIQGPELESEYFCFDALNIPPHHPARDLQDTFYTDSGDVLRTHTTSVSARALNDNENKEDPCIKVISPGKVFRNETEDATHQSMFHQLDMVWVEKGLTTPQLMGLISFVIKELFGKRVKVRFVPKFYPYTEPSIGVLIDSRANNVDEFGVGEFTTVAGAGMLHPNVLREFGYDTDKINGFAFGFGTSRLAAERFGFSDLRTLYSNDLRLLAPLRG